MAKYSFDDSKSKYEVYTKDDYAVITTKLTTTENQEGGQGYVSIPLPDSFTVDNTVVLSLLYKDGTGYKRWVTGTPYDRGEDPYNYLYASGLINYIMTTIGKTDESDDNNIYVQLATVMGAWTFDVKIVLMKHD